MGRLVRTVMDASALCHPPPNPLLLVGDRNASITVSCLRRAAWGVRRAPHSASTHSASERTGLDATGLTRAGCVITKRLLRAAERMKGGEN
ncbi:hypothetical protein F7725_016600 [Dissostichus mawsoni]|uniref:Uncharacterized protein n=1 Tax=Dissostichus mawsoni TaxID=36200 RepID=A0A7J5Z506_DISMA|nr:hypothetical protein F7725_016600 [Dissostichus mawsoni]